MNLINFDLIEKSTKKKNIDRVIILILRDRNKRDFSFSLFDKINDRVNFYYNLKISWKINMKI